jgi:hypothetical protein
MRALKIIQNWKNTAQIKPCAKITDECFIYFFLFKKNLPCSKNVLQGALYFCHTRLIFSRETLLLFPFFFTPTLSIQEHFSYR